MGTSAENFCLRWNDFESNVSSSFREIRSDADFFDVTLATSDSGSRTLQAHKVILSACSNFFKQILRQQTKIHSHPNPLIYLRGVTHSDLMSVLDFMYHGEVNVAQDDLNSFLAVAEELQIKGLTNKEQSESPSASKLARPTPGRVKDPGPPPKRVRKSSPSLPVRTSLPTASAVASTSVALEDDDDIKEVLNVKMDPEGPMLTTEPDVSVNPDEEGYDDSYGEYYDDGSGGMEGDGTEDDQGVGGTSDGAKDMNSEHLRLNPDGSYWCTTCNQLFKTRNTARQHESIFHAPPEYYECCFCKKVIRSKALFRSHVYNQHKVRGRDIVNSYGRRVDYPD